MPSRPSLSFRFLAISSLMAAACSGTELPLPAKECAAGAAECAEGKLRSCGEDGAWRDWTDCPGAACADATSCRACANDCAAGASECVEGRRRSCEGSAGCTSWSAWSDCASGACADGQSCGGCVDECGDEGLSECSAGALRRCVADSDGCLAWSEPQTCQSGACADATSCGSCEACPSVEADCQNGKIRSCSPDAHGCAVWSAFSDCPEGWCASESACGSPPPAVVISEIRHDSAGSPDLEAFVEIAGAPGTSLEGMRLVGVNGNGGADYQGITLRGQIPEDGYFLVAHPNGSLAAGADQTASAVDYQNGPDSVQLRLDALVLDAVAYGAFGVSDVFAGEGSAAAVTQVGWSLSRDAALTDTDDNSADFAAVELPTPGRAAGSCVDGCVAGAERCVDGAASACGIGPGGCLEWSAPAACESGLCRDGQRCDFAPQAAIGCPSGATAGAAASFDAGGSSDADGDALSYAFDFGDGQSASGSEALVEHAFAAPGSYTVTVTVADPSGASDSAQCALSVEADPASVSAPRPIAPLSTATASIDRPTLSWALAAGTDGAQVEICADRACTAPIVAFAAIGSSGAPPQALPAGTVFWRLKGRAGAVTGSAVSATWQLTVRAGAGGADTSWGTAMDLNGDGFEDAAISAATEVTAGESKVFYFHGGAGGLTLQRTLPLRYTAELDAAGDVDGDGFGDAVFASSALHVYRGGAGGLEEAASYKISGSFDDVAGLGDVNGDGWADLAAVTSLSPYRLRVYPGSASGPSATPMTEFSPGAFSTLEVVAAGDVNGDGFADALVTNCRRGLSGCGGDAWLHLGGPQGLSSTAAWSRETDGKAFVAGAGDVNADGFADFAVSDLSQVAVYFGSAAGPAASPDLTLAEPAGGVWFGWSMAFADLNGDGRDDLVVGDPGVEKAHSFLGPSLGAAGVAVPGETGHSYGEVVATAGDVNGDGRGDVLVAAPDAEAPATWEYVHLLFGTANGISYSNPTTQILRGDVRNRQFGYAMR